MAAPDEILEDLFAEAEKALDKPSVKDAEILERIEYVCRCTSNRACVRLLMACMLAKLSQPNSDPRQPYTEIGEEQCFSGRTYDERYITHFINKYRLPRNSTTAFLTPALRNIARPLTTEVELVGRPRAVYSTTLKLLDDVAQDEVAARSVLFDVLRILVRIRNEKKSRINELIEGSELSEDGLPLSAEQIVTLIEQHLKCPNASRLPVLVVAATYEAAREKIGERVLPLKPHTAADEQAGSIGDVEVCLINDDRVVTCYEMKLRRVTVDDIDRAIQKIVSRRPHIDNCVFITIDEIELSVAKYATGVYERTGGTEVVVLDCIGFLRHFLHFFHRLRHAFFEVYQRLLLAEPESAVRQSLKEAFFVPRCAAESKS